MRLQTFPGRVHSDGQWQVREKKPVRLCGRPQVIPKSFHLLRLLSALPGQPIASCGPCQLPAVRFLFRWERNSTAVISVRLVLETTFVTAGKLISVRGQKLSCFAPSLTSLGWPASLVNLFFACLVFAGFLRPIQPNHRAVRVNLFFAGASRSKRA